MWERRNAPPVPAPKETPTLAANRPGLACSTGLGRPEDSDPGVFEEWLGHIAAGRIESAERECRSLLGTLRPFAIPMVTVNICEDSRRTSRN